MKPTTERDDAIRKLAQDWSAKAPAEAETWAAGLTEKTDRTQALNLVCLTLSNHSPVEAIAMAERHSLGDPFVQEIIGRWADKDFNGASSWVTAFTSGETRNDSLARLALSRSASAPEEAATLVALSMKEGNAQEEAAMSVLHQWLKKDPQAAAEWISAFPDGPLRERGLKEVEGMMAYAAGQDGGR